jgi:ornithine decarboxylase
MSKARFMVNAQVALDQYKKIRSLSNVVSYSSKTNPTITPILEKHTDAMFSIHTTNELKHITDMSRVIFLAQAWSNKQIDELVNLGIRFFVVDNEQDLDTFEHYLNDADKKLHLLLRVKLKEMSIRTERYYVFGMSAQTVNKRIEALKQHKNLAGLGVHFHRKTQNVSEWNVIYEIEQMLTKETLQHISWLNIGGGLPSLYANSNVDVEQGILDRISDCKQWLNDQHIEMMVEPGRYIAAPAVTLHTHIIGIHQGTIIVDASVYNSDMDALVVPVKLKVEGEVSKEQGKPYAIKGSTPCSMDLFRYRVYLKDPKVGDTITFINAGAYNFSTDFCDLEQLNHEIHESS